MVSFRKKVQANLSLTSGGSWLKVALAGGRDLIDYRKEIDRMVMYEDCLNHRVVETKRKICYDLVDAKTGLWKSHMR